MGLLNIFSFFQSAMTDGSFGAAPPGCPEDLTQYIQYPSIVAVFLFMMFLNIIFAVICYFRYNSVKLYNQNIKSSKISNNMWVLYFLGIAVSDLFVTIQYALNIDFDSTLSSVFLGINFFLKGLITLLLTFALHHQFKYRCGSTQEEFPITTTLPESQSLQGLQNSSRVLMISEKFQSFKGTIDKWQISYFLLLVAYMICLVALFASNYDDIAEMFFLIIFFIQQVPTIILILFIVLRTYPDNQTGPLLKSKILLMVAALVGLPSELPLNMWALILPEGCVFYIASWVDLIHLVYSSAVVFFFFFIRSEYLRNMKEYHWNTVTHIQRSFN